MTESTMAPPARGDWGVLPPPAPGPDERREHLQRTLDRVECSLETLTKTVDRSFGAPHLVVATGSIPAGFGTPHSDLDLFTIVPSDDLTLLPLTGYELPIRLEVRHLSERELHETENRVRGGWPPRSVDTGTCSALARRQSILDVLVRLALGVELEVEASEDGSRWQAWRSTLAAPWLVEQVLAWRWWEAWRLRAASRWLAPSVAAQRLAEATVSIVDALAAEAGHIYTGVKWLPRKLVRMDAPHLLEVLQSSQRFLSATDMDAHVRGCDSFVSDQLDQLAARHPALGCRASIVFTLAPGVEVVDAYQRQFVTRWRLRAVELRPPTIAADVAAGEKPLWQGDIDEDPPDWMLTLLREGMVSVLVARDG